MDLVWSRVSGEFIEGSGLVVDGEVSVQISWIGYSVVRWGSGRTWWAFVETFE